MPRVSPFEAHTERYEAWFDEHDDAYRSELAALEALVSPGETSLEIGVGTGRFAGPLGIDVGLDPSLRMLERARDRGVEGVVGVAEALPFADATFDTATLVTTICFVDDVPRTLAEARRVLATDGALVVGYIDRESPLGRQYQATKAHNPFYSEATFVATDELVEALTTAGFSDVSFVQTLFQGVDALDSPDTVEDGHGEGSFVAIKAMP